MSYPIGTWLGLETQPSYEAPGDLWLVTRIEKNAVITIELVRLSLDTGPKLVLGQPRSRQKISITLCDYTCVRFQLK